MGEKAQGKKIGRGNRQASRAMYKATNRQAINAKKRAAGQESFIDHKHHECHTIARGTRRAARRAKWQNAVGCGTNGKPALSFATYEKRETGMSAWEYQHSIFGSKQESNTLSNLRNKLAA